MVSTKCYSTIQRNGGENVVTIHRSYTSSNRKHYQHNRLRLLCIVLVFSRWKQMVSLLRLTCTRRSRAKDYCKEAVCSWLTPKRYGVIRLHIESTVKDIHESAVSHSTSYQHRSRFCGGSQDTARTRPWMIFRRRVEDWNKRNSPTSGTVHFEIVAIRPWRAYNSTVAVCGTVYYRCETVGTSHYQTSLR